MKSIRLIMIAGAMAGLLARAQAAPLVLDLGKSKVEVAVDATMDSFVGKLEKYEAVIEWQSQEALPSQTDFKFDFRDLKTGNKSRDEAMLKWLEYATYPQATFHFTGWKQTGENPIARGELTMHGVKREIEMPITIKRDGGTRDIAGHADINHLDFNLPKIRKMAVLTVKPMLKVSFHLVGQPPATL